MNKVIQVQGLRKTYGKTIAVEDISFEVFEGEIFGMVGPNGAGKTTTIECLEGLRKPDRGEIQVLGLDPQHDGKSLKKLAGMQLQQSNLPDRMRVWEALDLYASFYDHPADWKVLMDQLGLKEKSNAAFGKLSGGQKQRLFIGLALLPDPPLVCLDELTTGLDPQARHAIWDLVRQIRDRGKTILLTTHFMEEAEQLCDRIAIIDHGKLVALNTPQELTRNYGGEGRVIFYLDRELSIDLRESLSRLGRINVQDGQVTVFGKDNQEQPLVSQVVNTLTAYRMPYHNLRSEQPNLEDVFLKLTGREMRS